MEIKTNESAKMSGKPAKLSKPWQPPKTIECFNKKAGMRYKWCRKDILEKRRAEGWVVTSKLDLGGKEIGVPHNLSLDSTYQHRGLILCEMPEEMAESRNAYYQKRAASAQEGIKNQFKKEASKSGIEAYNPEV
mgnify:CR=1 FL=1